MLKLILGVAALTVATYVLMDTQQLTILFPIALVVLLLYVLVRCIDVLAWAIRTVVRGIKRGSGSGTRRDVE